MLLEFLIFSCYVVRMHVLFYYFDAMAYVNHIGGRANFLFQDANRKSVNFGFIPQAQIRKFLGYASPQIANPQYFMINPQIANLQISYLCQSDTSKSENVSPDKTSFKKLTCFLPFHGRNT
jgi:hypothetical protein